MAGPSRSAACTGLAQANAISAAAPSRTFFMTLPRSDASMDQVPRGTSPSVQTVRVDQRERCSRTDFENFFRRRLDAVPPPAAERLKQCRSVGQSVGPRLDDGDHRLQIGLLRKEQEEDIGVAGLHLLAGEIEADLGGAFKVPGRSQ